MHNTIDEAKERLLLDTLRAIDRYLEDIKCELDKVEGYPKAVAVLKDQIDICNNCTRVTIYSINRVYHTRGYTYEIQEHLGYTKNDLVFMSLHDVIKKTSCVITNKPKTMVKHWNEFYSDSVFTLDRTVAVAAVKKLNKKRIKEIKQDIKDLIQDYNAEIETAKNYEG